MGAWEKFQLGWLNYEVAIAGQKSEHKLGPAETNTKQAQGLFVVLPDKQVTTNLGAPYAGSYFYYSGAGNNLDTRMYRAFTLPAGAQLTAQVRYRHRDRLGLRLPGRLDRRRRDLDERRHQSFDQHQPERPELRQRHHGHHRRRVGRR